MEQTLIDQGITLMLYGMGTVFVFLTVLVFATTVMSKLVTKFSPPVAQPSPDIPSSQNDLPSAHVMQAIKQAIAEHRKA